MPIPLVHSIASWFLKKRIHQMELFVKYPQEVQFELLNKLISRAKFTEIGMKYDFSSISGYETFANRVPVQKYEDYEADIERSRRGEVNIFWPTPIKWFAKSSGTTNAKSKFIPVSEESLQDCHYQAAKDVLTFYYNFNPDSDLLTGKGLVIGGSHNIHQVNDEVHYGDLSAVLLQNSPFWGPLDPHSRT